MRVVRSGWRKAVRTNQLRYQYENTKLVRYVFYATECKSTRHKLKGPKWQHNTHIYAVRWPGTHGSFTLVTLLAISAA